MTNAEIEAWATRAGIAAAAMTARPAMMERIEQMVGIAFERNPSLPRNEVTHVALTVLAWEQLSAAAKAAAQPQTTEPT